MKPSYPSSLNSINPPAAFSSDFDSMTFSGEGEGAVSVDPEVLRIALAEVASVPH